MVTPEHDEAVIFNSARWLNAPEARHAYLNQACGEDRSLRARVESLLRIHDQEPSFLQSPAEEFEEPISEGPGTVIGPYKLLEQIGEGGFGVVFMAEQEHPLRRKVALKVIKPGMDTRQVIARFEAERQALALMDHPHIAKVFDAGAVASGERTVGSETKAVTGSLTTDHSPLTTASRPYFVMELVRGVQVTEFCDQNHLPVRQRLELFITICQAVQHAHQKGIIHRDLKPSNVLVTLHDGTPVAKVIDFGIAKAMDQKLTDKSLFTSFPQMVGTPIYMSPEQAEMSGLDVDTRTDIYALGVLLYELLTGTTPFDRERLRTAPFDEIRRIIREEEPARPSAQVSTLGAAAATVTANRGSDPKRLSRLMRGELDWIVMKCLEKDRTRRYETAAALARDIRRFLDSDPVEASPPSASYRLRKLLQRNKGPVLGASLVLLALVGGITGTTLALIEARRQAGLAWSAQADEAEARVRETQRAEAEANERQRAAAAEAAAKEQEQKAKDQVVLSRSVIRFLLSDLLAQAGSKAQADRRFKPDPNLTVREALDRAATTVGNKFQGYPKLEAVVRLAIGNAYRELGEYDKAIAQLRQSADILAQILGRKDPETLRALHDLALAYSVAGQMNNAIQLYEEVRAAQMVNPGPEHPDTLSTLNNLATAYMEAQRTTEALTIFERVRDTQLRILGPEDPSTLTTLHNLADIYCRTGRMVEAVKLFEQLRSTQAKVLHPDHPLVLGTLNNLATAYWQLKQLDKSVPLFEQLLLACRKVLGDQHPETLQVRANLGVNYRDAGRLKEAIELMEQVHRDGQKYESLRWVGRELLLAHARAGNSTEALALAKATEARARKALPAGSPELAGELSVIGSAFLDLKQWTDAEKLLRESVAIRENTEPNAWTTFDARSRLGGALLGQRKYADAEPLLFSGFDGMKERESQIGGDHKVRLIQALQRLVQLYDAWDKKAEADKWRKELGVEERRQKK